MILRQFFVCFTTELNLNGVEQKSVEMRFVFHKIVRNKQEFLLQCLQAVQLDTRRWMRGWCLV